MSNPNGNGLTISQMTRGRANQGMAEVPTQTFYASNIAGTTVPKVGSAQSQNASNAGAMAGVTPMQIAIIVLIIIGGGYLLHHLSFEEGIKVG